MSIKKILFVFGTRPEAIKLSPLINKIKHKASDKFDVKVCITGQHKEMLDTVLEFFEIIPDYNLAIMVKNQSLNSITTTILNKLDEIFNITKPDFVVVHGDTTSSMAASLASFYHKIDVIHVEAGLRTGDIYSPFPEEINRSIISKIAKINFAPTERAFNNLINENVLKSNIFITGNTVIDALFYTIEKLTSTSYQSESLSNLVDENRKIILITGHRRENIGTGFQNICESIRELSVKYNNFDFIYPVHMNPNVNDYVHEQLSGYSNIKLIKPLDYIDFVWLMNKSYLVLTDSGGIQEEAPSLGKPVVVLRELTERQEAVEFGTVVLAGTDKNKIINSVTNLLEDRTLYNKMSKAHNPYGDGNSCQTILDILINQYA